MINNHQQIVQQALAALEELEYDYLNSANHETDTLTEDYAKHRVLQMAARIHELTRLLISSSVT